MAKTSSAKIDIFAHILPVKYSEAIFKAAPTTGPFGRSFMRGVMPRTMWDLEHRFRTMDKFEGYKQVLTLTIPPVEAIASPKKALELAKLGNDEMAELVLKHPDRFAGAVACLPMNDVDIALTEVDRAIKDLKLRGVLLYSHINDKPLDSPEFMPLYEKMSQYDLPIWIHPRTGVTHADYPSEKESKYTIHLVFGWPYETTVAMARLVFSGVLEKYPNLKIITHHCGAMVPYLEQRIQCLMTLYDEREHEHKLKKAYTEYFKMFYNDTAIQGNVPALMLASNFFGADHLLFGTDTPYDPESGAWCVQQTIESIEQMDISDAAKKKIFEGNARRLLRLPT